MTGRLPRPTQKILGKGQPRNPRQGLVIKVVMAYTSVPESLLPNRRLFQHPVNGIGCLPNCQLRYINVLQPSLASSVRVFSY